MEPGMFRAPFGSPNQTATVSPAPPQRSKSQPAIKTLREDAELASLPSKDLPAYYSDSEDDSEGDTHFLSNRGNKLKRKAKYTRMHKLGGWQNSDVFPVKLPASLSGHKFKKQRLTISPALALAPSYATPQDDLDPKIAQLSLPPADPIELLTNPLISHTFSAKNTTFETLGLGAVAMIEAELPLAQALTRVCDMLRGDRLPLSLLLEVNEKRNLDQMPSLALDEEEQEEEEQEPEEEQMDVDQNGQQEDETPVIPQLETLPDQLPDKMEVDTAQPVERAATPPAQPANPPSTDTNVVPETPAHALPAQRSEEAPAKPDTTSKESDSKESEAKEGESKEAKEGENGEDDEEPRRSARVVNKPSVPREAFSDDETSQTSESSSSSRREEAPRYKESSTLKSRYAALPYIPRAEGNKGVAQLSELAKVLVEPNDWLSKLFISEHDLILSTSEVGDSPEAIRMTPAQQGEHLQMYLTELQRFLTDTLEYQNRLGEIRDGVLEVDKRRKGVWRMSRNYAKHLLDQEGA